MAPQDAFEAVSFRALEKRLCGVARRARGAPPHDDLPAEIRLPKLERVVATEFQTTRNLSNAGRRLFAQTVAEDPAKFIPFDRRVCPTAAAPGIDLRPRTRGASPLGRYPREQ